MDTVVIARDMGDLLDQMKDKHGAVLHYQKATDALAALKAADPDNLMASERYAEMLMILGGEQAHAGQPAARANASRGLALTRELAARSDVTADALSEYAVHFLEAEPKDLRDPSTALQYAKMSADKGGTGPEYLDVLARAYFESGDSKNAIATAEKALSSLPPADPKQPASPLRERLQKSLARFKGAKQD